MNEMRYVEVVAVCLHLCGRPKENNAIFQISRDLNHILPKFW
jgi:hypothetical protein